MRKAAALVAAIVGVIGALSGATGAVGTDRLAAEARRRGAKARRRLRRRPGAPGNSALTATDVNAWLDGFMPYAIGKGDIPGAVVVVVKDGQVLTERGYGYADVAKKTKVDPADDAVPARARSRSCSPGPR